MNTVVFSKFDHLRFDDSVKSVERTSRNYLEVIDGQHTDLLSSHKVMDDTEAVKHRRNGYVCDPLENATTHVKLIMSSYSDSFLMQPTLITLFSYSTIIYI